jgi:uncharacterized membrane protein YfhO
MAITYFFLGIYPGSSRSVLASDAFSQFSNFHASFRNMLLGKQGLFYNWNASLGLNYLSLVSYYLGGLFTPLVIFFPNHLMPDALYFLTLIKIGCAGLAFYIYAKNTFRLPNWHYVGISTAYALMSFATAHSEIIMWLDTFVYLPLIILGINRVLEKHKPTLLFVSYLLLFMTSFYMGFMVGIFSFLYFLMRVATTWRTSKKGIVQYLITSVLSGLASFIIVLPAIIDLHTNGEELSTINTIKTEATGFWDIIVKNMVGVYDTTKYGSIPFIYVGLLPLIFCIFFFITKKIKWPQKVGHGVLFVILIASFYLEPLNLLWQGMHSPNMFLFRFAYLFSFMVIMSACYAWETVRKEDLPKLGLEIILLMGLFCVAWAMKTSTRYDYVTVVSFAATLGFLAVYLLLAGYLQFSKLPLKFVSLAILLLMAGEAFVNTNSMLNGILSDWNYASRSLYTKPYAAIQNLVDQTKEDNSSFYRLENLDAVSSNDSFAYGYSGVSMFSSIRNRNSSAYLDSLGFRSQGTNLNIRYDNNTLLMDSFLGIGYNLAKSDIGKYGYEKISSSGDYSLYQNSNSLPLGFTTSSKIYNVKQPANDNLASQTNLFNALANDNEQYFTLYPFSQVSAENTTVTKTNTTTTYAEQASNVAKTVTYQTTVPAGTQAYFSLYPSDFNSLESSTATVTANGISHKSQIDITGQYYNLGYYAKETTVTFSATFYGTTSVSFQNPRVVGLNTKAYQRSVKKIKANGIDFKTDKSEATASVNLAKKQVVMTTIPYDKGWTAYVDGKKVSTKAFKKAFLTFTVPKGKHKLVLKYRPAGFNIGAILFIVCIGLFVGYRLLLRRKKGDSQASSNTLDVSPLDDQPKAEITVPKEAAPETPSEKPKKHKHEA